VWQRTATPKPLTFIKLKQPINYNRQQHNTTIDKQKPKQRATTTAETNSLSFHHTLAAVD